MTTKAVVCEFCERKFNSVSGLRTHSLRMHSAEIDAAKDDADREMFGGHAVHNVYFRDRTIGDK